MIVGNSMTVANCKICLNSGIFGVLIRCRHARHPRRSRSFDRHRRSADKTGWPSCRRRGIGAHSASTPHLESLLDVLELVREYQHSRADWIPRGHLQLPFVSPRWLKREHSIPGARPGNLG
jgi:hypothetical protein